MSFLTSIANIIAKSYVMPPKQRSDFNKYNICAYSTEKEKQKLIQLPV